jgi:putative ABC transport system permease protein
MASGDAVRYNRTNARLAVIARPLTLAWAGPLRQILFVLVGAVALVLLIACANIASLQLLRTTARAREIAVRLALGATRWDIIRLFATESLLLALTGGALGVALGQWLITTAGHGAAEMVPELAQLRLDPLVLAFSIATTLVTALVFGTAPAIHALRTNSRDVLNATTRNASAGRARSRVLHGAVVIQLAISLVLLLACTVTVRSFVKLLHVDPGFDATGVLTARLVLPQSRYRVATIDDARRVLAIHQQLANRLRAVSGFEAVGITDTPPFGFRSTADASMHRVATWRGSSASATTSSVAADTWSIDGDYFRALRIPLIEGPGLTGLEHAEWLRAYPNGGDLPVIIDDALRRRLFPNESPIGKVVDSMFRVVGVVGAVKKSELTPQTDEAGAIYFPTGGTLATMTFVVRSSLPFTQAAARLRDAVHAFDPTLPLFDVAPLSDLVKRSTGSREIAVSLIGALAALSLVLALLGIYSVLSYATSQRTKEIGIRVALGADPIEVARLVMRGCATLTIAGLLAGLAGYVAVGRGLASLIYGVRLDDPRTLLLAITSLAIAALLAGLPTAIRAARVDPVDALRAE